VPVLEEKGGDAVARLERGDGRADGEDLACGVGARDARHLEPGVVLAEDDHEVAVVERGGVEADVHVVRAEGWEGYVLEDEVVETEGVEREGLGHGSGLLTL